jgi:hypothetical protein
MPAASFVASFFNVRCIRSCRPFLLRLPRLNALDVDAQAQ